MASSCQLFQGPWSFRVTLDHPGCYLPGSASPSSEVKWSPKPWLSCFEVDSDGTVTLWHPQVGGGFAVSAHLLSSPSLHRCWTLTKYHTPQTPSVRLLLEDWTLSKAHQIPLPIFIQSTRKGSFSPERPARPQSLVSSKIRQLVKSHSKLAGTTVIVYSNHRLNHSLLLSGHGPVPQCINHTTIKSYPA